MSESRHLAWEVSCWESLIEVGTLRASSKLSAHQNTQTRTHKQHLKSEKICEILQAMEVTVTTYPMAAKRPPHTVALGKIPSNSKMAVLWLV